MKKILFVLSPVFLLFITACSNECQDLLDEVNSARDNYQNNPSVASCVSYQAAINAYLNSSCESASQGVNYETILLDELKNLTCDSTSYTCYNGVQDGNETGVDCGGDCAPCNTPTNNYYFRFEVDGVLWNAYSGTAGFSDYPSVGDLDALNGYAAALTDQATISNFDNFSAEQTYLFRNGGAFTTTLDTGECAMSYHIGQIGGNTTTYYALDSVGSLTITSVNLTDSTVTGTFNLRLIDDNTQLDTLEVTNGEFYVPLENL